MAPLVSVLMSVFNGEEFLPGALDCILTQSLGDFEFIVVDDGSRDGTPGILAAFADRDSRLRVVENQENLGLTRSLARGVDLAQGEFLARQDVDDLSLPQRLKRQVSFLEANPQVVLAGTAAIRIDSVGALLPGLGRHPGSDRAIRFKMLLANPFFHASVMVRLQVLRDQGLNYDPRIPYSQDYDLWSRLLQHGQGANLVEPLIKFRVHEGQISTTAGETQQAIADEVAWRNLVRANMDQHFTPQQARLMRRSGLPPQALPPGERLRQLRLLERLFALMDQKPGAGGCDWESVKREQLFNLRKYLATFPQSPAMLRAQAVIAARDPLGAVRDVWHWLGKRWGKGDPGYPYSGSC